MKLKTLASQIHDWFFKDTDTWSLALFRVLIGAICINKFVFLYPDLMYWYTEHGIVDLKTALHSTSSSRINLFYNLKNFDSVQVAYGLWAIGLTAATTFCLGLWTRLSAFVLYILLVSFDHRNSYVLHGGDALMRVLIFWMIFARSNAYYSIDSVIAIAKAKPTPTTRQSAWPLRAMQIQVAIMYLATFWIKSEGPDWWKGTAVYTVSQLIEFKRYPLPLLFSSWILIKLATWATLLFEGTFAFLIWFRETRLWVIAFGLLFHLSLEWLFLIPIFQWTTIAAYALFLERGDLTTVRKLFRK